jgi:hypothetical protein
MLSYLKRGRRRMVKVRRSKMILRKRMPMKMLTKMMATVMNVVSVAVVVFGMGTTGGDQCESIEYMILTLIRTGHICGRAFNEI